MQTHVLYVFALMILGGLFLSRFAKKVHLPNVTAYLFAGLLLGPYLSNIISLESVESLGLISDISLGFIAFSIGSEFKISYFKRVGMTPVVIAILEASLAVILVDIALILMGVDFPFAIVLGSIAAATAPAATVMVIKQYKSKGSLTDTLLSVVAIDDAIALILFGLSIAIAQAINTGSGSILSMLQAPLLEIVLSILLGLGMGIVLTFITHFFESRGNRLSIVFAFVFLAIFLSELWHASALLLVMSMSAMYANLYKNSNQVMELLERATPPLFIIFFVISGTHLDLSILPSIGMIGTVYILVRVIGKYLGAYLGAVIMNAEPKIKNYLGPALIPQAGVAIGLSLAAENVVPEYASSIRAIILCATLIYELVGPAIAKTALQKAGEIQ